MGRNRKSIVNAVIVKELPAWIERKRERQRATYTYQANGESYYTINGERYSVEAFDKMFPAEHFPPTMRRENYDRTKNYIKNQKSY